MVTTVKAQSRAGFFTPVKTINAAGDDIGTGEGYTTQTISDLVYSTFLGGLATDAGYAIVADAAGNAYVTGQTASANFPATSGAFSGLTDLFIAKVKADGSGLAATDANGSAEPLPPACFALGPFEEKADIAPIIETLADRGITGEVRQEEEMDVRGFRVLVPTHSLDEAVPVVDKIRDSGDKDVLFLREGVHKGKVSVGVYARRVNAEVRQRQIDKLDIDTEIEPIGDVRTTFWVDLMLREPGGLPEEVVRELKEGQPDLEVVPRSCEKAGL